MLFVKRFADYTTVAKASVLEKDLVLDSLAAESSSVTVLGTGISRENVGDWALLDGRVYLIAAVNPDTDRSVLTLSEPVEAFSRPFVAPTGVWGTIGAFIATCLQQGWIEGTDPVYATPYLQILDTDSNLYTPPALDNSGRLKLSEYIRLMRRSYRTTVTFSDGGDSLRCSITTAPAVSHQVSFSDGHSRVQQVDYSASGVAKITAYQDGVASDWYRSDLGEISQTIPARRATGRWETLDVASGEDVQTRVTEAFAAGQTDHRVTFWSDRDLQVQDACVFNLYGALLRSEISSKRQSGRDKRYFYKTGSLRTTAAEKLKGVI